MGLSSEEDIATVSNPISVSVEEVERLGVKRKILTPGANLDTEAFVSREIKRRTMWSCFVIDRYLSSGRARPQMDVGTLHIQLPCSADDFRLGTDVKTEFLHPSAESLEQDNVFRNRQLTQHGTGSDLSIYIRLVEIWSRFSKWSCAGGRRSGLRGTLHQRKLANITTGKKNTHPGMSALSSLNFASNLMNSRHLSLRDLVSLPLTWRPLWENQQ
jgi:hypothetical protein